MNENKKFKLMPFFLFILPMFSFVICGLLMKSKLINITALIATLFPPIAYFVMHFFVDANKFKKIYEFLRYYSPAYSFSMTFFLIGELFSKDRDKVEGLSDIILSSPINVYIFIYVAGLVYALIRIAALNENINIKNNSVMPIDDFINKLKGEQITLAVSGNLLSLKTQFGMNLLKKFLDMNDNNNIEIYIPDDSRSYIEELEKQFKNYKNRIKLSIIKPFVFQQGIVIALRKIETDYGAGIVPVGYYLYKPKQSENEEIAKNGVFVDIDQNNKNDIWNYAGALYRHLNYQEYNFTEENEYLYIPYVLKKNQNQKDLIALSEGIREKYIIATFYLENNNSINLNTR